MCDPVTAAALVGATTTAATSTTLSLISAGATIAGGVASYKSKKAHSEATAQASRDAYILETHLQGQRLQQENAKLVQQKGDNHLKRLQGEAGAVAAAAAGGVGGNSVATTINQFTQNENVVNRRLGKNNEMQEQQMGYEALAAQARAQNRINSAPPPSAAELFVPIARGVGKAGTALSDYKDMMEYGT